MSTSLIVKHIRPGAFAVEQLFVQTPGTVIPLGLVKQIASWQKVTGHRVEPTDELGQTDYLGLTWEGIGEVRFRQHIIRLVCGYFGWDLQNVTSDISWTEEIHQLTFTN